MPNNAEKEQSKPTHESFLKEVCKHTMEILREKIQANKHGDKFSDWLQANKKIKKTNSSLTPYIHRSHLDIAVVNVYLTYLGSAHT